MARHYWHSLLKWSAAVLMLAGTLAAAYTINDWMRQKQAPAAESDKKRAANGIVKLGAELAESHGVKDEPAVPVVWYQRVRVYGRVVPNPQATVEVRSPFAGTLRADPACAWPTTGRWVRAGQVLGHVDIRAGPQERF